MDRAEEKSKTGVWSAEKLAKTGIAVIAIVFGGLIAWSVLAPIDGAVIATGQVAVESNRKTIQHLEGGVVREILIREGQFVEEGDVLVRMDNTNTSANLALIDSQLSEFYAQRLRLVAERNGSSELGAPKGIDVVLSNEEFQRNLTGQTELWQARLATHQRQKLLITEKITQQEKRIEGLSAQQASVNAQLRLIADELVSLRELYEKGFAPLTRVRALEREKEDLSGQRGQLISSQAESQSVIAEANLEIERLDEVFREKAIEELRDVSVNIAGLEERRVAAAHAVEQSEIKAPQAGQVIGLSVHTIGGVITPSGAIADIVPAGDRLEVAARVAPNDIDKVRIGQEALIRFSAFSARQTPEVLGEVRTVSGDRLIDPITNMPYFLVLVDLPEAHELSTVLNGEPLVPGMPAETFIRTGKQPAISYLLRPLTDAIARSMRDT